MTRYIGKGERGSLRKLYIKDQSNTIIKTLTNWYHIESTIIEYNKEHFQQAHKTKVYEDKIYHKLKEDKTRDKIL